MAVSGNIAGDKRAGAVAGYDAAGARMIVFGGSDQNDDTFNDVWELSLPASGPATWTQILPAGAAPSARVGTAGEWDAARSQLIVWGGFDNGGLTDA